MIEQKCHQVIIIGQKCHQVIMIGMKLESSRNIISVFNAYRYLNGVS